MKVYLQWAKSHAEDWLEVDAAKAASIRALPKRGVPAGESVDDQPGWFCGLNVQGIDFTGYDHVAIEVMSSSRLIVTGWVDDPDDYDGKDVRWGVVWDLRDPAPDPRLGGAMNTVQTRTVYATPLAAETFPGVECLPWEQFVVPPANLTLHGIWLPDDLFRQHKQVRTSRGWREWIR